MKRKKEKKLTYKKVVIRDAKLIIIANVTIILSTIRMMTVMMTSITRMTLMTRIAIEIMKAIL